jgi:hypothetical protein
MKLLLQLSDEGRFALHYPWNNFPIKFSAIPYTHVDPVTLTQGTTSKPDGGDLFKQVCQGRIGTPQAEEKKSFCLMRKIGSFLFKVKDARRLGIPALVAYIYIYTFVFSLLLEGGLVRQRVFTRATGRSIVPYRAPDVRATWDSPQGPTSPRPSSQPTPPSIKTAFLFSDPAWR